MKILYAFHPRGLKPILDNVNNVLHSPDSWRTAWSIKFFFHKCKILAYKWHIPAGSSVIIQEVVPFPHAERDLSLRHSSMFNFKGHTVIQVEKAGRLFGCAKYIWIPGKLVVNKWNTCKTLNWLLFIVCSDIRQSDRREIKNVQRTKRFLVYFFSLKYMESCIKLQSDILRLHWFKIIPSFFHKTTGTQVCVLTLPLICDRLRSWSQIPFRGWHLWKLIREQIFFPME